MPVMFLMYGQFKCVLNISQQVAMCEQPSLKRVDGVTR